MLRVAGLRVAEARLVGASHIDNPKVRATGVEDDGEWLRCKPIFVLGARTPEDVKASLENRLTGRSDSDVAKIKVIVVV